MTELFRVAPEAETSEIYLIKGQKSRWSYPNRNLSPEDAEKMRNINISEKGVARSRNGYTTYNATQLSGGEMATGLWQGKFAGTQKQVVVTPSKVYSDNGSTRTNITGTDLTGGNNDIVQFEFLKEKLIINNAVDQVRTWTGDDSTPVNTTDLTGMPWTKCDGIFTHNNLLLAWGTTEGGTKFPTRLRWCDINRRTRVVDIETWRDDNRYEIYDGGPAIVAATDNWGKALIFKEDGLYIGEIFYDVLGLFDFRLDEQGTRRGFSPISKHLVVRPEFVAGIAKEGIFVIRPDFSVEVINRDDSSEWFGLNKSRYPQANGFAREKDHQVRFAVSSSSNTSGHDLVLVWDWEEGHIQYDFPVNAVNVLRAVEVSNEELDWYGAVNGFLYQGNKSTYRDDNGTGYTWQIKMSPNDLGLPGKDKHVLNIQTLYRKREGSSTVNVRVHVNEGRDAITSGSFSGGTDLEWDTGESWNTGKKWPGAEGRIAHTFVNTICQTVAPEWTGSTPASIVGYIVEWLPLE